MINKRLIIGLILGLALYIETSGQASRTTFSSFGLGLHSGQALASNRAMGGMGISMPNYTHLNTLNPALLVFNRLTIIEGGFIGEQRRLRNDTISEQSSGINVNYFALGFPVKPGKWTTGIGLSPDTYMNYKTLYTTVFTEGKKNITQYVEESGTGGLNALYWSNGVRLHKNLSVGLKATYFFGTISDRINLSTPNSNQLILYTASILDRQVFSGVNVSAGVSFHIDSIFRSKNHQLNVGVVYNSPARLATRLYSEAEYSKPTIVTDSTLLLREKRGTTIYPQSIGCGISIGNQKTWLAGIDFSYKMSSQFRTIEGSSKGSQNSWAIALGSQFTPGTTLGGNYLKRITYRIGFNFKKTPYILGGNTINDMSMSVGLSLPVQRISTITLAGIFGQQGDLVQNGMSELYFQLYCGIAFSDRWFIRRKFD